MIHPALLILIKLRIGASLRWTVRRLKRPRGVLLFALWLLLMCAGAIPWIAVIASGELAGLHLRTAATEIIPLALMLLSIGIVVKSSGESAIFFSPSEIDFLFSGPFSRRELLVFKLSTGILAVLLMSLVFSPGCVIVGALWVAVYVGTVLTLVFLQLLGMSVAFIGQTVAEHIYTRTRKTLAMVLLAIVALGAVQAFPAGMRQDWLQMVRAFRNSSAASILLAPFEIFSRTILAERLFPDLVLWGGLALAIDLALLAFVIRLDANYLEAAAAVSQKIYGRLERMKRGGMLNVLGTPRPARWSLPRFPWMGGVGPIAWRQLSVALRSSRRLLAFVVTMFAISGVLMAVAVRKSPQGSAAPSMGIGVIFYVNFILGLFFFPHDPDQIESLKSLPLRSTAIACGELSGVVGLLTLLQALYFCLAAIWIRNSAIILIVAAVFTVPFNLVLFGVEKLVFLLYPTRLIPNTPGDFLHVGRQTVFMLMKIMILFVCYGAAATFGAIACVLTGSSPMAFAAVTWVVLILEGVGLIHLLAWAFRRFDPSIDTPP